MCRQPLVNIDQCHEARFDTQSTSRLPLPIAFAFHGLRADVFISPQTVGNWTTLVPTAAFTGESPANGTTLRPLFDAHPERYIVLATGQQMMFHTRYSSNHVQTRPHARDPRAPHCESFALELKLEQDPCISNVTDLLRSPPFVTVRPNATRPSTCIPSADALPHRPAARGRSSGGTEPPARRTLPTFTYDTEFAPGPGPALLAHALTSSARHAPPVPKTRATSSTRTSPASHVMFKIDSCAATTSDTARSATRSTGSRQHALAQFATERAPLDTDSVWHRHISTLTSDIAESPRARHARVIDMLEHAYSEINDAAPIRLSDDHHRHPTLLLTNLAFPSSPGRTVNTRPAEPALRQGSHPAHLSTLALPVELSTAALFATGSSAQSRSRVTTPFDLIIRSLTSPFDTRLPSAATCTRWSTHNVQNDHDRHGHALLLFASLHTAAPTCATRTLPRAPPTSQLGTMSTSHTPITSLTLPSSTISRPSPATRTRAHQTVVAHAATTTSVIHGDHAIMQHRVSHQHTGEVVDATTHE